MVYDFCQGGNNAEFGKLIRGLVKRVAGTSARIGFLA